MLYYNSDDLNFEIPEIIVIIKDNISSKYRTGTPITLFIGSYLIVGRFNNKLAHSPTFFQPKEFYFNKIKYISLEKFNKMKTFI